MQTTNFSEVFFNIIRKIVLLMVHTLIFVVINFIIEIGILNLFIYFILNKIRRKI